MSVQNDTPKRLPVPPGMSRRHFLMALAGTAAFWTADEFADWRQAIAAEAAQTYTPRYFTPDEWRFLEAATEQLFPEDETGPGAKALGVVGFIDRQMDTSYGHGGLWFMSGPFQSGPANLGYQLPYAPREIYRIGIAGADRYCRDHYGHAFADLDHPTQIEALTAFEKLPIQFDETLTAGIFFEQLRTNTMEGAFSDPIHGGNRHLGGWVMLGFPGARADFMDWVDQYGPAYPLGSVSISGETA
ncbi:MAG: gluconate 2-dehydrogenase subunit 3 family protein [Acetobacter sp.]|uniref:gluconate 2-dehydrogenase subunit 3 family protein n=1 Tax=Acetobacter sp. TaxID=440 RepID=UPI0039E7F175